MENENRRDWWKTALTIWLALFTIFLIIGWEANQNRIKDIQRSRVQSCERTYEGIRMVFKPFLAGPQTQKQKKNIQKFNNRIDTLKSKCVIQTKANR